MYGVLSAGALSDAARFIWAHGDVFLIALAVLNVISFCFYAADKYKAKRGKWRVPESTLILLSFIGGSVGAFLGMQLLRHKTKHIKFIILVPLSLVLHIAIIAAVAVLSHS